MNNAGANWGAPHGGVSRTPRFDKVFAINVKGVFHLTRFMVPLLEKAATDDDPARVINIGSIDGLQAPMLDTYSYSSSKAAVHHLTRVLAHKLAPKRITVNAIAPGPFESKMMAETLERFGDIDPRHVPARPHRPPRRHGRHRDLPVVARGRVPHRRGDPGRRRHLHPPRLMGNIRR